ncbi:MAG: hypothetical protein ABR575_05880 [Actinomycetota bacterium]
MSRAKWIVTGSGIGRELRQGIVVLALTGSSVGGVLSMLAVATRALGR